MSHVDCASDILSACTSVGIAAKRDELLNESKNWARQKQNRRVYLRSVEIFFVCTDFTVGAGDWDLDIESGSTSVSAGVRTMTGSGAIAIASTDIDNIVSAYPRVRLLQYDKCVVQ